MQLTVTVADPLTQVNIDLLVDVDEATTVAELTRKLVDLLRGAPTAGTAGVTSLASRRHGNGTLVRAGGTAVRQRRAPGPLAAAVHESGEGRRAEQPGRAGGHAGHPRGWRARLRRGAPPDHGEALVGSAQECPVRLDLPDVPSHAFTAAVHPDGTCTVVPQPGVDVWLEQTAVEEETPWPEHAYLRVGTSLVELRRSCVPDAALQPSDDGVSLDYNRPPAGSASAPTTTPPPSPWPPLRNWWDTVGRERYPGADRLLICADGAAPTAPGSAPGRSSSPPSPPPPV